MDSLIKSDIFFFISSISTIITSVLLFVVLVFIIKILRDLKDLSSKAKEEGGRILDDVKYAREATKNNGALILGFFSSVFSSVAKNMASPQKEEDVSKN